MTFEERLRAAGFDGLRPVRLEVFQINVGKLCNMRCRHCHVDAGPERVDENMDRPTMEACLAALDRTEAHTVDITGGAPELNPHFRWLVDEAVARRKHVIVRCNLTVLLLAKNADLPEWLAAREVEIVASLPHWRRPNTDAQRGDGTWERSIEALRRLNAAGYGDRVPLTLMHNPVGAFVAGNQAAMEREWKAGLAKQGVRFDRLLALTNMPINRFEGWLRESGNFESYTRTLEEAFNPAAVPGVMCRNTISVGWDGTIADCDFNQMLGLAVDTPRPDVRAFDADELGRRRIRTGPHCFGCTAGAGSSCGGATT